MSEKKFTLDDFNFKLPEDLIAQYPMERRDESRLFILDRKRDKYYHKKFNEITNYLNKNDLLVFNNARVINGRIYFQRETGGIVEVILTQRLDHNNWLIICNKTKKLSVGEVIFASNDFSVSLKILERIDDFLKVESNVELDPQLLKSIGEVPLPPYIKRSFQNIDEERYQTVYAEKSGAVAAPTAGLHFTTKLLSEIKSKGIDVVFLTLFVSWGTFQPVREKYIDKHKMHNETFLLSDEVAAKINGARNSGKRVIAVGTTSLRVLESTFRDGRNVPGKGETDIFIYPPYKIKSIDALITNFHTPRSTLLMLVSAFAGYQRMMNAYEEAVKEKYRFFSYGDAMLIT